MKFHIVLTASTDDAKTVKYYERVTGSSLVELISKFLLSFAKLSEIVKEENKEVDDDIPF